MENMILTFTKEKQTIFLIVALFHIGKKVE